MTKQWILSAVVLAVAATLYATASSAAPHAWTVERYYTAETWRAFADVGKKDNGGPDDVYAAQQSVKTLDGSTVGVVNGYGVNLHAPTSSSTGRRRSRAARSRSRAQSTSRAERRRSRAKAAGAAPPAPGRHRHPHRRR
jgi:hypothetical protein